MDEEKKVEELSGKEAATEEVQAEGKKPLELEPAEKKAKKSLPLWGKILIAAGAFLVGVGAVLGGWIGARIVSGQPALPEQLLVTTAEDGEQKPTLLGKLFAALGGNGGETSQETDTPATVPADTVGGDSTEVDGSIVVARCGTHALTAGQLQVYYRMQYFNFMNQYGAYAEFFGMDVTKPLDEQDSIMEGYTWDAYFRAAAMEQYGQIQAVCQMARAAGFVLPAEMAQGLEELPADLDEDAVGMGYASGEAYIKEIFGSAVTMEDYLAFAESYYTATAYQDQMYNDLEYTDEDLDAYYATNEAELNANGIVKQDVNDVTVRHILIRPEDTDGDGDISNEADTVWAAAKAEAERILNEYLADPTEENFSNLAAQYSADGNAAQGGIYEGVYPGQMVETFNDWSFDANRRPGDTGIVETQFGYHVMYFVRAEETQHWRLDLEDAYQEVLLQGIIEEAMEAYPVETLVENPVLQPIPVESAEDSGAADELQTTEP